MPSATRCTPRKATPWRGAIRFGASVSSQLIFRTSMGAAARRFASGDPEDESRSAVTIVTTRLKSSILLIIALAASGCAAGSAFSKGNAAMKTGDLDQAVAHYRTASQAEPDNTDYQIAL